MQEKPRLKVTGEGNRRETAKTKKKPLYIPPSMLIRAFQLTGIKADPDLEGLTLKLGENRDVLVKISKDIVFQSPPMMFILIPS